MLFWRMQGGCGVGRPFFHVTRCANDTGGGFSTDYGVRCAAAVAVDDVVAADDVAAAATASVSCFE
jgi:hypothetical protein